MGRIDGRGWKESRFDRRKRRASVGLPSSFLLRGLTFNHIPSNPSSALETIPPCILLISIPFSSQISQKLPSKLTSPPINRCRPPLLLIAPSSRARSPRRTPPLPPPTTSPYLPTLQQTATMVTSTSLLRRLPQQIDLNVQLRWLVVPSNEHEPRAQEI